MRTAFVSASLILVVLLLIWGAKGLSSVSSQESNVDYDTDDDGLIEISYLEQLEALRDDWDGEGLPLPNSRFPNAEPGYGCPIVGPRQGNVRKCRGYELTRPLDFQDPASYASNSVNPTWTDGTGWDPIRIYGAIFDGNGHTISNLFISRTTDSVGLFAKIESKGQIRTTNLDKVNVTGRNSVGGLVGVSLGTIFGSHVTGRVSGENSVGGLAGGASGRTSDSSAAVSVSGKIHVGGLVGRNVLRGVVIDNYATAEVSGEELVGGLVGRNDGLVFGSYATGSVSGESSMGGLAGHNNGRITGSYATSSVTGKREVGGLAGLNERSIIGSYATGGVFGTKSVGGLAGLNRGTIFGSYAAGDVAGRSTVGGLAGLNNGRITGSYATGSVAGKGEVGGLAGYFSRMARIDFSYATGRVSGRRSVGGLAGSGHGEIRSSFWDTQTSGQQSGVGGSSSNWVEEDSDVYGKTTDELQSPTDYTGIYSAWDTDLDNADRDDDETTGVDRVWDFGTATEYPRLRINYSGDVPAIWQKPTPTPTPAPTPTTIPIPTPPPTPTPDPTLPDYDADDDGLIEVSNLEQLSAIRYDLDGDGKPETNAAAYAAAFHGATRGMKCPSGGCLGYELANPLDFLDPASYASNSVNTVWTDGGRWNPIGLGRTGTEEYTAVFDGNGHTISNLFIYQTFDNGLFGVIGSSGSIVRTGLEGVDVTGTTRVGGLAVINKGTISDSYVTGLVSGIETARSDQGNTIAVGSGGTAGGLVGANRGAIVNSYAVAGVDGEISGGLVGDNSGRIDRSNSNSNVSGQLAGGLVGGNRVRGRVIRSYAAGGVLGLSGVGGLVGNNIGSIVGSYASGSVSGKNTIGGLVGNNDGSIVGSYASGSVSGEHRVGGLAGINEGSIIGSYATGSVSGTEYVGALVGNNKGRIKDSFWNTQTSCITAGVGLGASAGLEGQTTEQLQSSTGYNGIYSDWNIDFDIPDEDSDDPWDFGGTDQYPVLKADIDGDGTATWEEFGNQNPAGPTGDRCGPAADSAVSPAGGSVEGPLDPQTAGGSCIPFLSAPPGVAAGNLLLMIAPLAILWARSRRPRRE